MNMRHALCWLPALVLLLTAQASSQIDGLRQARESRPMESWLLGSESVLVDYFWFDLIQYFGAYRLGQNDLTDFKSRAERLFKLDRAFHNATIFSSAVYAGDLSNPEAALLMLERGESANPENWIYPYEQGFINYLWLKDYEAAADAFERAGRLDGVTPGWRNFLARIRELGGDPRVAIDMWRHISVTAEHSRLRENAIRNMERLQTELDMKRADSKGKGL